jgi:putative DNA primase/helicase
VSLVGTVDWVRVTQASPCPVCQHTHWCSVSANGALVFCMREPSDRPAKQESGQGWLHRLAADAERNGRAHHSVVYTGPIVRHPLRDQAGTVLAVHCRRPLTRDGKPDKKVWWELPDGSSGTGVLKKAGLTPGSLPLYGVETLVGAAAGAVVVVCEGEKAADAVRTLGLLAVGTVTGAPTIPDAVVLRPLVGFDAVLWPDNDDEGRAHMVGVGARLCDLGGRARVLCWTEAPVKGDAAEFVAMGCGLAELRTLYAAAVVLAHATAAPAGVVEHRLADLQPETVRWLWRGRIPFGKITVLDGDPGLGKSTISLDVAARLTRGDLMPDGTMGDRDGPRSVLLLTVEDGLTDTILPRLMALGADLTRVVALESVPGDDGEPTMPAVPRDLAVIEARIVAHDAALIIFDPLIAFLGDSSQTNSWKDQDVRRALGPFAHMLERIACASILIRHLTKGSGGNPVYRGGGSIGIIGAARSGLMVAKDPDDDTGARRVLVPTKANLSAPARALAYHMEQAENGSVRIVWEGETEHTALGLLAEPLPEEERSAIAEAVDFLKGELDGDPVLAEEIKRRARAADVSDRTLKRARQKLRVVAERLHGPTGPWSLRLPVLPGTRAAVERGADA